MSNKTYFGTDGIRGVAGEAPLDPATVYAIGLALGEDLGPGACVIMGEDTRESGAWIAQTLAAGLLDRGVSLAHAGVLPTPGIAYLTRTRDFRAGVMISASHNPYQDNGIKVFGHTGYKLPDAEEARVEAAIAAHLEAGVSPRRAQVDSDAALFAAYVAFLAERVNGADFGGLKIVIDCAHGAAHAVAAPLARAIGLEATVVADAPDGRNINAGVGALYPEKLAARVLELGADAGVALDGDADRAILVDARGRVVNGDCVLLMVARDLKARGLLDPALVVGTVMTNLGLELAFRRENIALERAPVGDKYVLERMQSSRARLGGEPSGHVIFGAEATTGDGLLTALRCFELMARRRLPLRELCQGWTEMPQRIVNVKVRERLPLEQLDTVQAAIAAAETDFDGSGRVLVRYSGTEKLARVMVEAESAAAVDHHAQAIANALQAAVGI